MVKRLAIVLLLVSCSAPGTGGTGGGAAGAGGSGTGTGGGTSSTGGGTATGGGSGGGDDAGMTDGGADAGTTVDAGPIDAGSPHLVGITADPDLTDGGVESLLVIDPQSGGTAAVAGLPNLNFVTNQNHAVDPALATVYLVGAATAGGANELYVVDAVTGASTHRLLDSDAGFSWHGLFVRGNGDLVGLAYSSPAGAELRNIDTATGHSRLVRAVPGLEGFVGFARAIDRTRNRIYVIGDSRADLTPRLFVLNSQSGNLVSNAALDAGRRAAQFGGGLHVRSDGVLLGLEQSPGDGGPAELVRVDPATGAVTAFASISGLDLASDQTTDPVADRSYVVDGNARGGGVSRLFTIDLTDGGVLAQPVLQQADAGSYNWSGGLHVYYR